MSLDYSPEMLRQHEAHKAVMERLNRMPVVQKLSVALVRDYQPKNIVPVDNASTMSAESLWLDWLSQQHLAEGYESVVTEPAIGRICREVRLQFGVEKMDFLSARRNQKFVVPRQVAMALCKHLTRKSLPEIGRRMGGRDHTTILHGCRKLKPVMDAVSARLEPDAPINAWVAAMKEQVTITPFAPPQRYGKKAV